MIAELMRAPVTLNTSWRCECGTVKHPTSPTCQRCAYLDGSTTNMADIIEALRGTDGLTLREICEATGRDKRRMHDSLQALMASGRVRRYMVELDAVTARRGGGLDGWDVGVGASAWAYVLDGDARRVRVEEIREPAPRSLPDGLSAVSRRRRLRAARRAQGLCTDCGVPALPGYVVCGKCRDRVNKRWIKKP